MRTFKKKITLIIEKTDTGFSAYSEDYPVFTTGRLFSDLLHNAVEALNLFMNDQGLQVSEENIQFEIDLQQFFRFYRVINSKFLAERIGMNETLLSQYVQGRKKPSAAQTNKILTGIREIGTELSSIHHLSI